MWVGSGAGDPIRFYFMGGACVGRCVSLYRLLFLRWVFHRVGTVSGCFRACEGVPRGGYSHGAHGGR